jgi:hypothetical protein
MSRPSRWIFLCVSLSAGGCTFGELTPDLRLRLINVSDEDIVVRLGYRDPDAGRVEKEVPFRSHMMVQPYLFNDKWGELIRRSGKLTIEFCREEDRSTVARIVMTEADLDSVDWTLFYPRP